MLIHKLNAGMTNHHQLQTGARTQNILSGSPKTCKLRSCLPHRQVLRLFSRVNQFPNCCTSTPLPSLGVDLPGKAPIPQGWWAVLFLVKKCFVRCRTAVLLYRCETTCEKTPHPFGFILLHVLHRHSDASSRYLHLSKNIRGKQRVRSQLLSPENM